MADASAWDDVRLEGDGVVLRRWRGEDLEALIRHANDARVSRGTSDRFPFPYTRQNGEDFLAGRVVDFNDPVLAIEIGGEACGGIGIRSEAGERRHGAELGYWLGHAHWGQGLMTRIVATYAPWVMEQLSLLRLQATVLDINPASARVLLKNGFSEEGVLRSAVMKPDGLHDLRMFSRLRAP